MADRVLLTGATGFVGRHLYAHLRADGACVRCASRAPEQAQRKHPDREWMYLDVNEPESVARALTGCVSAYYLIHSLASRSSSRDYEEKERRDALRFAEAAAAQGVRRLIYLGGVMPSGEPSKHLRSRIQTGEAFRKGPVATVELRAGMIVGHGSESWQIVRDLSMRLPLMLLPSWLQHRSEPVAVRDVITALIHARKISLPQSACYSLPGPEALTGQEILERVARLRGLRPMTVSVPFVTPRLSSYWIRLVTRANYFVARELVEGMTSDLVAQAEPFWSFLPEHQRSPFDVAARGALDSERASLPWRVRFFERTLQFLARKTPRFQ